MNTKAAIIAVVAVAVVAGGAYVFLSSTSGLDTSYSKFLPESTLMVMGCDSPQALHNILDPAKYPNIFQEAKEESTKELGFDATDIKVYIDNGVAVDKPAGFAILDILKTQYQPLPVFTLFAGVKDEAKFDSFLRENIKKGDLKVEDKDIDGVKARLLKPQQAEQVVAIYCFKDGYWVLYGVGGMYDKLEEKFKEHICASGKKLADNDKYKNSLAALEKGSEMYMYLDLETGLDTYKKHDVDTGVLIEQFLPKGMLTTAMAGKIAGNAPSMSSYVHCTEELVAKYKNEGNCADILANFPAEPHLCFSYNNNVEEVWKMMKDQIDKALNSDFLKQQDPQFKRMTQQLPAKNVDGFLKMGNDMLKKQMNLDIDIEKDIVLNFQGNSAFALYGFPTGPKAIDFDAVLVAKLKDSAKMAKLLADVMKVMGQQLPMIEGKVGDAVIYTVDMEKIQPPLKVLSPTFGVSGDYLMITVKKATFEKISKGEGGGFFDGIDADIAKAMKNGDPSAGYVNLAKFVKDFTEKVVPKRELESKEGKEVVEILNHFKDLTWQNYMVKQGFAGVITLNADTEVMPMLLKKIDEQIKKQKEQMKKWREEMEERNKAWDEDAKAWDEDGGDGKDEEEEE